MAQASTLSSPDACQPIGVPVFRGRGENTHLLDALGALLPKARAREGVRVVGDVPAMRCVITRTRGHNECNDAKAHSHFAYGVDVPEAAATTPRPAHRPQCTHPPTHTSTRAIHTHINPRGTQAAPASGLHNALRPALAVRSDSRGADEAREPSRP